MKQLVKKFVPSALYPSAVFARHVRKQTGNRVIGGPFEGMQFVDRAVWGAFLPKVLGTYEQELHPIIESLPDLGIDFLVDIGGAEGFYAVGLLRLLPGAELAVFEMLADGRAQIETLARMNRVSGRLKLRGACDPASLRQTLAGRSEGFVLCDVEGYERELLDPERVPELRDMHMLVEVHDHKVPGCTSRLRDRFGDSHDIEYIEQRPRVLDDYPLDDLFSAAWPVGVLTYALNEFRDPCTAWMWLVPGGT